MMKTCVACGSAKPLEMFNVRRASEDGRHYYCRDCSRAKDKAFYDANESRRQREKLAGYPLRKKDPDFWRRKEYRPRVQRPELYVGYVSADVVYSRDAGRCQLCNEPVSREEMTFDHKMPLSRGGEHSYTNVQLACDPCNRAKRTKTNEEYFAWCRVMS